LPSAVVVKQRKNSNMYKKQEKQLKKLILPRIDNKLSKIANRGELKKREDYVNHLLRRRSNLMRKLGEY